MEPRRILIVLPNWVGDVVLASPALESLRARFPAAEITFLCRRYVADVVRHSGWMNDVVHWPDAAGTDGPRSLWQLGAELRRRRFDLAVLLPNSFKSALAVWLGRVPRRVGYSRDARGWMLTDRLAPLRDGRAFKRESMLDYYNRLAEHVGCRSVGRSLKLVAGPEDDAAIRGRLGDLDDGRPLVLLNPGGAFGTAKLWPAERFAEVGDALATEYGARVIATGTPAERSIFERLAATARSPQTHCYDPPLGLGPLKALMRRADLLVTNDTGPRHFAIAFDVPVVTVFGPTAPEWTETNFPRERKVMMSLSCMPCQQKLCPLGHTDCMRKLTVEPVLEAARALLAARLSAKGRIGSVVPASEQLRHDY